MFFFFLGGGGGAGWGGGGRGALKQMVGKSKLCRLTRNPQPRVSGRSPKSYIPNPTMEVRGLGQGLYQEQLNPKP